MENNLNEQILDKLTKVCLCKAIPRIKIKNAIRNGALTVDEIKKVTGAGSGGCSGKRCTPKIQDLINTYLDKQWE